RRPADVEAAALRAYPVPPRVRTAPCATRTPRLPGGRGPSEADGAALVGGGEDGLDDGEGVDAFVHGDDVVAGAVDGVAEAFLLHGEGLALGQGVAHDVALGDAAELGDAVPRGGHGAVGVEHEVPGHGVGDQGAALTGDDGGAFLHRGQPVDHVVDDDTGGQPAGGEDHVLVLTAGLVGDLGGDLLVGGAGDERGEVHVVGGQVLDHPDVGDPRREGALA